jgi:1,2-diacylglycerol 3-beta-glucosyltransferase
MILVSVAASVIATVFLLPIVSDVLSMARSRRRAAHGAGGGLETHRARLLFLVPAHDEELLVVECVRSVLAQDYPAGLRGVVVVADNCTDATAALARDAGAEVLVRTDPDRRGKPHALAWALARVRLDAWDAVVIVDADSIVAADFAARIAATGHLRDRCVQGFNGISNPHENALTRMSAVFAAARYCFAFPLKQRAGLNVPLTNGMCLGTNVLKRHGWPAFSLSEDWEIYTILTAAGEQTIIAPDARVLSQEARSLRQSASQRKRWSAGRLDVLWRHWRSVVGSACIGARQKLDIVAELAQPGPAVQLGVVALVATLIVLLQPPAAIWLLLALGLGLAYQALYAVLGVMADPEPLRAALAFVYLPGYAVWRLGVQFAALALVGSRSWIRTGRHRHT